MSKDMTGSQAVLKSLVQQGVSTIFGYANDIKLPIYENLSEFEDTLKLVTVCREQAVIHAARGFSKVSKKVGVCFSFSEAGTINLLSCLNDAMKDSTPLICITSLENSILFKKEIFHLASKKCSEITTFKDIAPVIQEAFQIAKNGRPGPVIINISKELQLVIKHFPYQSQNNIAPYPSVPVSDSFTLKRAATLINQAKRPFIIVGQGVLLAEAQQELMLFTEKAGIPLASTLLGLGALPSDHYLFAGLAGVNGHNLPNSLSNECDVLLAIGLSFDHLLTGDVKLFAQQAKIIHINIDQSELNKNVLAEITINADAREALEKLTYFLTDNKQQEWLSQFKNLKEIEFGNQIVNNIKHLKENLTSAEVITFLSDKTAGSANIVSDINHYQLAIAKNYQFKKTNCNITSGTSACTGFSIPGAIGAKIADQSKTVLAIINKASFDITIPELTTLLQENINIKIVIFSQKEQEAQKLGKTRCITNLMPSRKNINPQFSQIASAYDILYMKIDNRKQLRNSVENMLSHPKSFLLEILID